ncbi:MAG: hypothetical protein EA425_06505 [Puniceicoccaceae bacterium]|nr:MAG: hypothetical protein EA425_06505 [Puniceicoccaceae bacterium]
MGGLISGAVIAFCLVIGFAFSGWGDWYYDAEPPIVEGLEVMESEARPGGFYLRVSNPSGQTVQSLLVKLNERAENGSLTRIFEDYVAEPLAPGAELETLITLRDPVTFQALDPAGRSLEIRLIQGYTAY